MPSIESPTEEAMCKTLKLEVRFNAPPEAIYDLLADSKKRTVVTGREASLSDKIGGAFSADAGKVGGINVELVPCKRIVQAWRRDDFPEGVYSMAAFVLTEANWRNDYWAGMKAHLAKSGSG